MIRVFLLTGLLGLLFAAPTPSPACNPPASSVVSYHTAYSTCATSNYVAPAAPVYYAYPLTVLAVPVAAVVAQPAVVPASAPAAPVPAAAPVPTAPAPVQQEQMQATVPAAPLALTLAAPQPVVQRQFYASYAVAPSVVVQHSYSYGMGQAVLLQRGVRSYGHAAEAVVVQRARTARAPVFVQRRFAPIRNRIARARAGRAGGGVPSAAIIIRR